MLREGFVFNKSRKESYGEMISSSEIYEIMSNIISEKISEILCNSYADRSNFKLLISNLIKPQMEILVKEHENHCLEVASSHLIDEFNLDSNIDYNNTLHAKLYSIVNDLKNNFSEGDLDAKQQSKDSLEHELIMNKNRTLSNRCSYLEEENLYLRDKLNQYE
jgi:hypothetical protein